MDRIWSGLLMKGAPKKVQVQGTSVTFKDWFGMARLRFGFRLVHVKYTRDED